MKLKLRKKSRRSLKSLNGSHIMGKIKAKWQRRSNEPNNQ